MKQHDPGVYNSERPSALFVVEDGVKAMIGGPLYYAPHFGKMGGLRANERVLDFGCGSAAGTKALARMLLQGGSVTGVDISVRSTRVARRQLRRFPNAEVVQKDIRGLYLKPGSYDVMSIMHVTHDIVEPKRQGTVAALARALKPGARLWILEPTRRSHGMSARKIGELMHAARLEEQGAELTDRAFGGVFARPAAWQARSVRRSAGQPHRHLNGLDHALGVRPAQPGLAERGAVVHGGANDRQPQGDVDAAHPEPAPGLLVVPESGELGWYVPLIVVHGHHEVERAAHHHREHRVRGKATLDRDARGRPVAHGRLDLLDLLATEEPSFPCVRAQSAHRHARPLDSQLPERTVGCYDDRRRRETWRWC